MFEKMRKIYELRLMMDYTGFNRGYAFVVLRDMTAAKESVRQLHYYYTGFARDARSECRQLRSLCLRPKKVGKLSV